jgi:hypothetical protein
VPSKIPPFAGFCLFARKIMSDQLARVVPQVNEFAPETSGATARFRVGSIDSGMAKNEDCHSFLPVAGFGSGAYSAKLFAGTRHRLCAFSQPRQNVDPSCDWVVRDALNPLS